MNTKLSATQWRYTPALLMAILSIAAFLTRLLPLSISQYPYNNDSLTECSIASQILGSGHLSTESGVPWDLRHSLAIPALDVVIAFFSSALGTSPINVAQPLTAVVSVSTVGAVFLLARRVSGGLLGAVSASFSAVMMGTFVFTTGSAWKEMLGISLLVLTFLSYIKRGDLRFRVLTFVLLMTLPLVHHLVAVVALLAFSYLLGWSWYLAYSNRALKVRHIADLLMVAVPAIFTFLYYYTISFNRLSMFYSPLNVLLFAITLVVFGVFLVGVLSIKNHSRWTFAPFVGVGLTVLLLLDYFGLLFHYSPSASRAYYVLIVATVIVFSLAWYGTEFIIEHLHRYRAFQVALLISPVTVVAFGLSDGFSISSQQVVYRTFDFLDIFIFLGVGATLIALSKNRRRLYPFIAALVIVSLVASFPFGYYTSETLGVRHDIQAYEVDALGWVADQHTNYILVSDERISFSAVSLFNLQRGLYLATVSVHNGSLAVLVPGSFFMYEDSWTTAGTNAYPVGRVVLQEANYTWYKSASNVIYVGGPLSDHVVIVRATKIGHVSFFGSLP